MDASVSGILDKPGFHIQKDIEADMSKVCRTLDMVDDPVPLARILYEDMWWSTRLK